MSLVVSWVFIIPIMSLYLKFKLSNRIIARLDRWSNKRIKERILRQRSMELVITDEEAGGLYTDYTNLSLEDKQLFREEIKESKLNVLRGELEEKERDNASKLFSNVMVFLFNASVFLLLFGITGVFDDHIATPINKRLDAIYESYKKEEQPPTKPTPNEQPPALNNTSALPQEQSKQSSVLVQGKQNRCAIL